jgi:hypothetical protein
MSINPRWPTHHETVKCRRFMYSTGVDFDPQVNLSL